MYVVITGISPSPCYSREIGDIGLDKVLMVLWADWLPLLIAMLNTRGLHTCVTTTASVVLVCESCPHRRCASSQGHSGRQANQISRSLEVSQPPAGALCLPCSEDPPISTTSKQAPSTTCRISDSLWMVHFSLISVMHRSCRLQAGARPWGNRGKIVRTADTLDDGTGENGFQIMTL